MPNPEAMTDPAGAVERLSVDDARLALSRHLAFLASRHPATLSDVEAMRMRALSVFISNHDRLLSRITELEKVGTARDALMAALLEVRGNVRAHLKGGKLSADMRRKVLDSCDRGLAAASQAGACQHG